MKREILILAGIINFQNKKKIKNWGMPDSFIYSTAKLYDLRTITCDHHFKTLENTEIV